MLCDRLVWLILGCGLALRLAVAWQDDTVLHPDYVYQMLEPASAWAFGRGILVWEMVYGARFFLPPLLAAFGMRLAAALSLEPLWALEAAFCAASLVLPCSMYIFCLRMSGRAAARWALFLGCAWWELVVLAGRPSALGLAVWCLAGMLALAACGRRCWAACLGALCVLFRMQLAPAVLAVLIVALWRREARVWPAIAVFVGVTLAGGFADSLFWGALSAPADGPFDGLFGSYRLNAAVNRLLLGDLGAVGTAWIWRYPVQLLLSSCVLAGVALSVCFDAAGRRFLLTVGVPFLAVVLPHAVLPYQEYRFFEAATPLWLLFLAGGMGGLGAGTWRWLAGVLAAWVVVAGTLHLGWGAPGGGLAFYRSQRYVEQAGRASVLGGTDLYRQAFRFLRERPSLGGVWTPERLLFWLPGYSMLQRSVPLYDKWLGRSFGVSEAPERYVSHVLCRACDGLSLGPFVRVLTIDAADGAPLQVWEQTEVEPGRWTGYVVCAGDIGSYRRLLARIDPVWAREAGCAPDRGVRFAD